MVPKKKSWTKCPANFRTNEISFDTSNFISTVLKYQTKGAVTAAPFSFQK